VPTEDDFAPEDPLPLFLSGHAGENKQRGSLLLLNASILVLTATLVGVAITLSWGNPVKIFADVTASRTDFSSRWPDAEIQSTPKVQLTRDAQGSAPTARAAPDHDEIAAASERANQSQTENSEPANEGLFKQFQAWSAKEDARALDARAQVEPVQDAPAPVAENAPAPVQPMPKHRKAKSIQDAQAESRHVQKPRARIVRQEQNAQGQAQPVQDARAQEQPAQSTQPPSFLQSLGLQQ
jgi:hypothetical protein